MNTYGTLMAGWIRQAGYSYASFAREMELSSTNQLMRVLNDSVKIKALYRYDEKFRGRFGSALTPVEVDNFDDALEYAKIGAENFEARIALMGMITRSKCEKSHVRLDYPGHDDIVTLQALFDTMVTSESIRIDILNCVPSGLLECINNLYYSAHVELTVQHYILISPYEHQLFEVNTVLALMPVLNEIYYSAFFAYKDRFTPIQAGNLSINVASVQCKLADGGSKHYILTQFATDLFRCRETSPATTNDILELIRHSKDKGAFTSLNRSYPRAPDMNEYVKLLKCYIEYERGRATYGIKHDLVLNSVPLEILDNAFSECNYMGLGVDNSVINEIRQLQRSRCEDYRNHRQIQKLTYSQSGMSKFAETGRMSDHFVGFRPFTVPERVSILRRMLDDMQHNPLLDINFFKTDIELADLEIFAHLELGVQLTCLNTGYDLKRGYADTMITMDKFTDAFISFYNYKLLKKHVILKGEAQAFVGKLISKLIL